MKKGLFEKIICGIGILLAMLAAALGITALRIALFAPELMSDIFM